MKKLFKLVTFASILVIITFLLGVFFDYLVNGTITLLSLPHWSEGIVSLCYCWVFFIVILYRTRYKL